VRRLIAFVVFFSIVCGLLATAHYYLYARLIVATALGEGWLEGGAAAFTVAGVSAPTGMIAGRLLPREHARWVATVAYLWLGTLLLLLTALAASELARIALAGTVEEPQLSRALALGVIGIVGCTAIYGVASAIGSVAVRQVTVTLDRLPASMSGFKLVQLSDMHVGPLIGRGWVEELVARVNALEPDAVVITGDLVDGSVERLRDHVAPLADLRARHGVFFVTGNHEYYSGADAWLRELCRLGIRPLRNERVCIGQGEDSFDLAGVDDWRAFGGDHGADLPRALRDRDPSREVVLLAHQPKQIREAAAHGVGLQLSGHTHGGQIFPWNLFVRLEQPFIAGLGRLGGTQIYVSRGTGFWGPPMRVGAPAEITLLKLVAVTSCPTP
jgi:hypothetical protein